MSDDQQPTDQPPESEVSEVSDAAEERARQLRQQVEQRPTIPIDQFKRKSRRSFLTGAAGVAGAFLGWRWIQDQGTDDGIPQVLRNTLEVNEGLWSNLSKNRTAPEYPVSKATPIQVNGRIGIRTDVDIDDWALVVEGPDGEQIDELDLADFEAMPQDDMVIEHKCIEGWSSIVHWGGVRYRDFHERYADEVGDVKYVGLETPDGQYYVGWDIESILNPQTMLALREGTEPLDQAHGAPLRLATPNKYGIKCLKRIGVIRYTNERPPDYWAERSYDWYAAL
ncbi:MAG: molybdopterin-dependent oxidoreductase [Acidimicrobiia bacterium]|nr:molybdopterin-dependent oxidoreductase [Acidimicrobiia bacterium]